MSSPSQSTHSQPLSAHARTLAHADSKRLALGFALLVALTFGLIVLGALVRAHEAGLACPDWPLCFGQFVPQMDLRVAFEWTHRVAAGGISLVFVGLASIALRAPASDAQLRRLLAIAAVLLAVQIVLGALTVWLRLASWTVTAHLLTGNTFAATLLWIALHLRERSRESQPAVALAWSRWTVGAVALLLFLQMGLGGLVSSQYAGMACPEWPACNGGLYFPSFRGSVGLHLLHRWNGYALLIALGFLAWRHRRDVALRGIAALALGLGVAQVVVGIANVLTGIPVEVTGLHSALAASLVLTMAAALRAAFRAPLATRHS